MSCGRTWCRGRASSRTDLEALTGPEAALGESPRWDDLTGRLYWVDIDGGDLHWLDRASGERRRRYVRAPLASLELTADGRVLLSIGGSVYVAGLDGDVQDRLVVVDADEAGRRLNDSACDARGRLWTGTMRRDAAGAEGTLYRIESAQGSARSTPVFGSIGISNGIDWNLDRTAMYYVDTPTHVIEVIDFDLERGALGARRTLVDMDPARPDGLTVDAEGFLWVAVPSHGQVRRYSAGGVLDRTIDFPVRRITSCCFGGAGLDELYVTSARDADGTGGALYRCVPGVAGLTTNRFRL